MSDTINRIELHTGLVLAICFLGACSGSTSSSKKETTSNKAASSSQSTSNGLKKKSHRLIPFMSEPEFEDAFLAELMENKSEYTLKLKSGEGVSDLLLMSTALEYVENGNTLSENDEIQLKSWVYDKSERFEYVFRNVTADDLLPDSVLTQVMTRLVNWLLNNLSLYTPKHQHSIIGRLHGRSWNLPGDSTYHAHYWKPAFDLFAYDLKQFDSWQEAGYPVDISNSVAMEYVVCPLKKVRRRGKDTYIRGEFCSNSVYRYVLETDATRRLFADYLIEKKDAKLVETAFLNIIEADEKAIIALLELLEVNPDVWKAAWAVMCRYGRFGREHETFFKGAVRVWHQYASLRGDILLGLAMWERQTGYRIYWSKIGEDWGMEVDHAVFDTYLNSNPLALSFAYGVWGTLTDGWSRADVIIPHLDKWLTDPLVPEYSSQDPDRALRYIIDNLCREKAEGDLKKMREYIEKRIAAHPEEPLSALIKYTQNKKCAPKPARRPTTSRDGGLRIIQTED